MTLLVLGHGYSAGHFLARHGQGFGRVVATTRSEAKARALRDRGIEAHVFEAKAVGANSLAAASLDRPAVPPALLAAIHEAERLLVSTPPDADGDGMLGSLGEAIAAAPALRRIAYLSTVGVYGDHGGAWVDETTPCRPVSPRSLARVAAEAGWRALGERAGIPVDVLRLSGIYGPGRNALLNLCEGRAHRIVKPGQVFNRVHVADIAGATAALLARDGPGGLWNVTDDEPAPPQDVVAHAAGLLGIAPPPEVPFAEADLSPMGRSFYGENKRVSNRRLRGEGGYSLLYPTYREGLAALLADGEGAATPPA